MQIGNIYVQVLYRYLKKLEAKETATSSNNLGQTRVERYAHRLLRSTFYMFKYGDIASGRAAVSKLLKHAERNDEMYFACNLTLAIGFLSMGEYDAVVHTLPKVIDDYSHNNPLGYGLCDALIVLAEAYAALGQSEESLQSARLAVDVAHDALEAATKTAVVPLQSIIMIKVEQKPIAPCLSVSVALAIAYYTIACQLATHGQMELSDSWFERAVSTADKFEVHDSISRYIAKRTKLYRADISSCRYDEEKLLNDQANPDIEKNTPIVNIRLGGALNTGQSETAKSKTYERTLNKRPKRLPWRPVSPFGVSTSATVSAAVIRSASLQALGGAGTHRALSPQVPLTKSRPTSAPLHRIRGEPLPPINSISDIIGPPPRKLSSRQRDAIKMYNRSAILIQSIGRMYIAKKRVGAIMRQFRFETRRCRQRWAAISIQRIARSYLSRLKVKLKRLEFVTKRSKPSEVSIVGLNGSSRLFVEEIAEILTIREKMKIIQSLSPAVGVNNLSYGPSSAVPSTDTSKNAKVLTGAFCEELSTSVVDNGSNLAAMNIADKRQVLEQEMHHSAKSLGRINLIANKESKNVVTKSDVMKQKIEEDMHRSMQNFGLSFIAQSPVDQPQKIVIMTTSKHVGTTTIDEPNDQEELSQSTNPKDTLSKPSSLKPSLKQTSLSEIPKIKNVISPTVQETKDKSLRKSVTFESSSSDAFMSEAMSTSESSSLHFDVILTQTESTEPPIQSFFHGAEQKEGDERSSFGDDIFIPGEECKDVDMNFLLVSGENTSEYLDTTTERNVQLDELVVSAQVMRTF